MPTSPPNTLPILIFGASVRAAAASARRAGYSVVACDQFADQDLRAMAKVTPFSWSELRSTPSNPAILDWPGWQQPWTGWMYVGGGEHASRLWQQLTSANFPLAQVPRWAASSAALEQCRNPRTVQRWFLESGGTPLQVSLSVPPLANHTWLRKPLAGSGGLGISLADAPSDTADCYWQEFFTGESHSALVLSDGSRSQLLGVCQVLTGATSPASHASSPWNYCGNIGPIAVAGEIKEPLTRFAAHVAKSSSLTGLWGFDFLLRDHQLRICEINPRYTAAVELYEYADGVPWLAWHTRACQRPLHASEWSELAAVVQHRPTPTFGKAILYARHDMPAPNWIARYLSHRSWEQMPEMADIPAPYDHTPAGAPLSTLFATAATCVEVFEQLQSCLAAASAGLNHR